jgi:hypothetical protein
MQSQTKEKEKNTKASKRIFLVFFSVQKKARFEIV